MRVSTRCMQELFHVRPQVAQAALQTSRALCERWYTAYLEVRPIRRAVVN